MLPLGSEDDKEEGRKKAACSMQGNVARRSGGPPIICLAFSAPVFVVIILTPFTSPSFQLSSHFRSQGNRGDQQDLG